MNALFSFPAFALEKLLDEDFQIFYLFNKNQVQMCLAQQMKANNSLIDIDNYIWLNLGTFHSVKLDDKPI